MKFDDYGMFVEYQVEGRASIADLFSPDQRCGLYILHFKNDQYYAGQAVDVVRRYAQHRTNHTDIERVSFRPVHISNLNEEERELIWRLERNNYALRNITFTSLPVTESDFDLIMSPTEQQTWLGGQNIADNDCERIIEPQLRSKYTAKYQRLLRQAGVERVLEVLQTYTRIGIPVRRRSEVSFWCSSCLPLPHVFSRININWQEVLTLYRQHDGTLWSSFHFAQSPLAALSDAAVEQFASRYPNGDVTDHYYEPGGHDQINIVIPIEDAARFLDEPAVQASIRLFNLRLMRKGPCIYGRYHCLDLADHLID